jgi:hypothetical protein
MRTAAARGSGWRSAVVLIVIVRVLTAVPDVNRGDRHFSG